MEAATVREWLSNITRDVKLGTTARRVRKRLLHRDPGALGTCPLSLLMVDMPLQFLHRDLTLPACHASSIAPSVELEPAQT